MNCIWILIVNLQKRLIERATGQKFTYDLQVLIKVSVDYSGQNGLKLNFLDKTSD